jgi:RNA polymerase sigma-70 factor (ECF subfamily)
MNIASVPSEVRKERFEKWFAAYSDAVLRVCFLYLADMALAEDAMQDTFVKVWRKMDSFDGRFPNSEKAWIMRIAINTCKDYKRTNWFRRVDLAKAIDEIPTTLYGALDESIEMIIDVMQLPGKMKQAVLLYHYQNLTLEEVATILGVGKSTIHRWLQKAYALLRDDLKGGKSNE